jgi:hypothetical protein
VDDVHREESVLSAMRNVADGLIDVMKLFVVLVEKAGRYQ